MFRILQVLLDQRNGLELLAINFDCANVDAATSTALLLSLPPVHKYCIISVVCSHFCAIKTLAHWCDFLVVPLLKLDRLVFLHGAGNENDMAGML